MKTSRWIFLAALVAALGGANAIALEKPKAEPPKVTSAGSKGDYTPADEGKSSNPVPPVPVASAEKATGADARLADEVVKALNADASLKGSKIKVGAANGAVTLSGSVASADQAGKAANIAAKKAKGKISNELKAG